MTAIAIPLEPTPSNVVDVTDMSPAAFEALLDNAGAGFAGAVAAARAVECREAMDAGDRVKAATKAHAAAPRADRPGLGESREIWTAGHEAAVAGDDAAECPHVDHARVDAWFQGFLFGTDSAERPAVREVCDEIHRWIDLQMIQIGADRARRLVEKK